MNELGRTGYNQLSEARKKAIAEYIDKNALNVRKPKIQ